MGKHGVVCMSVSRCTHSAHVLTCPRLITLEDAATPDSADSFLARQRLLVLEGRTHTTPCFPMLCHSEVKQNAEKKPRNLIVGLQVWMQREARNTC
jgi:hypothetical protein